MNLLYLCQHFVRVLAISSLVCCKTLRLPTAAVEVASLYPVGRNKYVI